MLSARASEVILTTPPLQHYLKFHEAWESLGGLGQRGGGVGSGVEKCFVVRVSSVALILPLGGVGCIKGAQR